MWTPPIIARVNDVYFLPWGDVQNKNSSILWKQFSEVTSCFAKQFRQGRASWDIEVRIIPEHSSRRLSIKFCHRLQVDCALIMDSRIGSDGIHSSLMCQKRQSLCVHSSAPLFSQFCHHVNLLLDYYVFRSKTWQSLSVFGTHLDCRLHQT